MASSFRMLWLSFVLSTPALQAQFGTGSSSTFTTPPVVRTCLNAPDGGMVTGKVVDDAYIIGKVEANGTESWIRRVAFAGSSPLDWCMGKGMNGEIVVAARTSTVVQDVDWNDADTTTNYFQFCRLGASGNLLNTWGMDRSIIAQQTLSQLSLTPMQMAVDGTGNVLLLLDYRYDGVSSSTEIIKMTASGAFVWARNFGELDVWLTSGLPTSHYMISPWRGTAFALDAAGNVFISVKPEGPTTKMLLTKLGADGALLWANEYHYTNNAIEQDFDDVAVDGNGDLNCIGGLVSQAGTFHFLTLVRANGTLKRSDLFRSSDPVAEYVIGIGTNGDRYLLANFNPTTQHGSSSVLRIDTLGSPAQLQRRRVIPVVPNVIYGCWWEMDVSGNSIALDGLVVQQHTDLAYNVYREAQLKLMNTDLSSCFSTDTLLADIPVPLEIMTTEPQSNIASVDVGENVLLLSGTAEVTELPLEGTIDLCLLVTGIGEQQSVACRSILLSNVIANGAALNVVNGPYAGITVLDVRGAVVMRTSFRSTSGEIALKALQAGMYMVQATNSEGAVVARERFVVE